MNNLEPSQDYSIRVILLSFLCISTNTYIYIYNSDRHFHGLPLKSVKYSDEQTVQVISRTVSQGVGIRPSNRQSEVQFDDIAVYLILRANFRYVFPYLYTESPAEYSSIKTSEYFISLSAFQSTH